MNVLILIVINLMIKVPLSRPNQPRKPGRLAGARGSCKYRRGRGKFMDFCLSVCWSSLFSSACFESVFFFMMIGYDMIFL